MSTSLTLLLVPVIGLLSSAVLLFEPMNVTSVVGLILIVSAIAAVSLVDSKQPQPHWQARTDVANENLDL